MNRALLVLVVCCGIALVGCGDGGTSKPNAHSPQPTSTPTASKPTPAPIAPAVHVPADAPPDQVVTVFLDALKNGDTATKASLLTTKALEETTKHEFEVNPQSAPNTQYDVHSPEFLPNNPNGAHVTSVWTETYDDGKVTYDVVWVLRRQTDGWRIAGMAIELVPGQTPAFLNFEDPEDMAAKYNEAMAAHQEPAAETAAKPQDPQGLPANPIDR